MVYLGSFCRDRCRGGFVARLWRQEAVKVVVVFLAATLIYSFKTKKDRKIVSKRKMIFSFFFLKRKKYNWKYLFLIGKNVVFVLRQTFFLHFLFHVPAKIPIFFMIYLNQITENGIWNFKLFSFNTDSTEALS